MRLMMILTMTDEIFDLSTVKQRGRNRMPEGQLVWKKVLYKECAVAGVSYHLKHDDELWDELETGTKVALDRDRKNRHDKNAVAVYIQSKKPELVCPSC